MLDAFNALTIIEFFILVLAVGCTVIQLALLFALATHVNHITVHWGAAAVVLWVIFFAVTR